MRVPVADGVVCAKLDRNCSWATLWIDRADRIARSAGGVALTRIELEALIWQLANLRNHMAMSEAVAAPIAGAVDTFGKSAAWRALPSSHRPATKTRRSESTPRTPQPPTLKAPLGALARRKAR